MTEETTHPVSEPPADRPADVYSYEKYVALVDRLRGETKETLLLHIASQISWQARLHSAHGNGTFDEGVEQEFERIVSLRKEALAISRHRRFGLRYARIKAGIFPKPRRKRRKAKRKVAS